MSKLYELSNQFKNLEALLENEDLPKEDIQEALNGVQASIEEKISDMCKYIKNIENDSLALASEVKRLSDKKKANDNRISSIKEYMFEQLKALNMKSVKTTLFSVGIQNNPPSVKVTDEGKFSEATKNSYYEEYSELRLDKKRLLADLKTGQIIEGCEIQQSESLRIR